MKTKYINKNNLEINEDNYAAYESLMKDYIFLTQDIESKYNLDNNDERFFCKLIFIPLATYIGLEVVMSFESQIPFLFVSFAGISTMVYSLIKYRNIVKNLKQELKNQHPNIDTDVDFQELDNKLSQYVHLTKTSIQQNVDKEEYNKLVTEYVSSIEQSLIPEISEEKTVIDQKKLELSYKNKNENR